MRHKNSEFQLLKFLTLIAIKKYSVRQIAVRMNCTERTIYRRVTYAEEAGFCVDTDFKGKLFINKDVVPPFVKVFL